MLLIWCSYYALSKRILIFPHLYWHVIFTLNFMYKSCIWEPLPVSGLLLDMGCGLISSWNLHLVSGHEVSCAPQVLTSQDVDNIYIYICKCMHDHTVCTLCREEKQCKRRQSRVTKKRQGSIFLIHILLAETWKKNP